MARAATTSDVFSAIGEPRRREILEVLAGRGEMAVGDLAGCLHLPQPAVSKHLAVLREVGLVSVTRRGRSRLYRLEGEELKAVHDWVAMYERFWTRQLGRIKARAEQTTRGPAATLESRAALGAPAKASRGGHRPGSKKE
ncbi:MAG: helix-turn-helix transcriptional regulator [Phycisphaerales bacterium]|nr:helix-turn-helix transcriptional regulator [Phycisphaerales bacterium]